MPDVSACLAAATFMLISIIPFYFSNDAQPKPYMDEIFHVPQAKRFCDGNYSYWDPMITTLPGLYIVSVVILKPLSLILPHTQDVCSTHNLRAVNLLFMAGNMFLLYLIIKRIHVNNKMISNSTLVLNAWTLAFFPVLYFFSWMYYTDPGAVFFTLLMYYLNLKSSHFVSAIFGVVAIVFRQTNIIWVLFVLGLTKGRQLIIWMEQEKKDITRMTDLRTLITLFNLIFKSVRHKPSRIFELIQAIVKSTWCYIAVVISFITFVFINGGIVVGDKSHHQACLNFPQIFYFLCVTLAFSCMHIASPSKIVYFLKFSFQSPVKVSVFVLLAYYLIANYTYVHEYLLADNRHYPFYVWSKIFKRHENVKYGLIVVYLFAAIAVSKALENKDVFWKIVFLICLCACSIPQKLLEFRYFIIPYLIFRVNITVTSKFKLFLELLLYISINVLTVYIFIYKTFKWSDSDDLQRFMW
ncbi:putative Dol-P-Glc:Glc(2)Man(9)GlcNAc(2)-PP-Dol alpha-1,2-glucosyltransferase [Patella vulgata]|uniref:putative Dol-P-Glc:Glc(2)Man(9)GlcNAc(2)-PP-Dol alpha-1,2-glucosyltransferase n=1 Tax=Patella vulgata TaxID=6465 RepID=UPI0021805F22|nr:putative Dol-P-Glc:Glc(2)Man(9)GlcNAc(2)-PP-Dol alpha-1,2-glucosyltransferase [Patella vulgata]